MEKFLDADAVAQICFVTDGLDTSARRFADLLGKEMPPEGRAAEPEVAKATYLGQPATVGCRIRMFRFGNIDVEFLQPGAEPSAWRDYWIGTDRAVTISPSAPAISLRRTPISRPRATSCCNGARRMGQGPLRLL